MSDYKEQLTAEQMEKVRECKSADELVEFAKSEGVELSDEQIESISAGSWYDCMNETWCANHE